MLSFIWKVGRAVEGARLEYVFTLCVTWVRIPCLPFFWKRKKMKKTTYLIISFLLLFTIGFLYWYLQPSEEIESTIKPENTTKNTYITSPQLPTTMAIPTGVFKLIFIQSGAYIQDVHQQYNCKTTINGSYFGRNEDGTFFPAGIWLQSWIDIGFQNKTDPNLQEYLEIDEERSSIIHIKPEEVGREPHKLYINAWPLLVKDGEINTGVSQNISHRKQYHPRTILLITEDGQPYLYISFEKTTLYREAIRISNQKEFWKMTAINLDGWPSTAIYEKIPGTQFYIKDQLLPIFFCLQRGVVKM